MGSARQWEWALSRESQRQVLHKYSIQGSNECQGVWARVTRENQNSLAPCAGVAIRPPEAASCRETRLFDPLKGTTPSKPFLEIETQELKLLAGCVLLSLVSDFERDKRHEKYAYNRRFTRGSFADQPSEPAGFRGCARAGTVHSSTVADDGGFVASSSATEQRFSAGRSNTVTAGRSSVQRNCVWMLLRVLSVQ